jgi:hypothetical protein
VATPAKTPAKIVPSFVDKKFSLKLRNKIIDKISINTKATILLVWKSNFVVKNIPMGNPKIAPSQRVTDIFLSESFQPFFIKKNPAINSINQHIGINSIGGIIVTANDITKADNPKPENPLITPAKKQIKIKRDRSELFKANVSNIIK